MGLVIGVLDSGVGGLGVLVEIRRSLPVADVVYVADHAAAPYGTRSLTGLRQRVGELSGWLIDQGCGLVVIACNTASAAALHWLRRRHPETSFVGMEPAVKPAAASTRRGRIGVVATAATFQAELFASVVDRFAPDLDILTAACPRWVELVEEGATSGPLAIAEVRACLQPLVDHGVDTLVLACTHYPALTAVIAKVMGPDVEIIDPAPAVGRQTARVAESSSLAAGASLLRLHSTADPDRLETAARRMGLEAGASLLRLAPAWTPETSP